MKLKILIKNKMQQIEPITEGEVASKIYSIFTHISYDSRRGTFDVVLSSVEGEVKPTELVLLLGNA
jgi:hypothetical protein